jgi:integrase
MLSSVTYGDILHRYGEEVTPQKRSAATELQRIRQLQADPLSILPLANLDGNAVAAYRDRRLLKVKSGTVRRELAIISHTLEIARKEWGFRLPSNPVKDIRQPAIGRGRNRRLEAGEWKRLVAASAACRNNRLLPFIRLAVETAMRRSELIALRWDHVDLCRATLHIPVTKNGNSRTIPLTDEARAILLSLKGSEGSIFGMTTNAFKLAWTRIVQRSGLLDLHFHDLRHEAISRFAEMGLSTMELAVISGHRDLRMLQRYTHLRPSDLARKLAGRSWESEVGSPS